MHMSLNWRMDKQIVVYSHSRVLFSNKEKQIIDSFSKEISEVKTNRSEKPNKRVKD